MLELFSGKSPPGDRGREGRPAGSVAQGRRLRTSGGRNSAPMLELFSGRSPRGNRGGGGAGPVGSVAHGRRSGRPEVVTAPECSSFSAKSPRGDRGGGARPSRLGGPGSHPRRRLRTSGG